MTCSPRLFVNQISRGPTRRSTRRIEGKNALKHLREIVAPKGSAAHDLGQPRLFTPTHQLPGQKKQGGAEHGRDAGDRDGQSDGHRKDEEQRPEGTVPEAFDQVPKRNALIWCGRCICNLLKDVGQAPRFAIGVRIGWRFRPRLRSGTFVCVSMICLMR